MRSIPMCELSVERFTWKPKVEEASAVLKEADDASSFEGSGSDVGSGSEAGEHEGEGEHAGEADGEAAAEGEADAEGEKPAEGAKPAEEHHEEVHEEGVWQRFCDTNLNDGRQSIAHCCSCRGISLTQSVFALLSHS